MIGFGSCWGEKSRVVKGLDIRSSCVEEVEREVLTHRFLR